MDRTLTPRVQGLIEDAARSLRQARYEGSHVQRQDPAPREGSPWDTPDAPREVIDALDAALAALAQVVR